MEHARPEGIAPAEEDDVTRDEANHDECGARGEARFEASVSVAGVRKVS
jgi:hypothetical protein